MTTALDKAGRKLDGKYAPPQTAAHPLVHAFSAFGRGEGDKRRTSAAFRGIDVAKTTDARDLDMDAGEVREVDLDKLAIGKGHLVRGRLARAAKTMGGKPRADGEGVKPITVVERADKPGHYVVVRDHGEHRVAALKINGHSQKVPVRVVKAKGAAKDEKAKWIADKIALLVGEGREQSQAVAIANAMWNKDHGVAKIMTTGAAGAGSEFVPTNVMPGSPQKVSERRAQVRERRRRRQRKLGKESVAESKPAIEAQVTNEIKRRINALATAVDGLADASVQRLRRAARIVSREVSRAKRARVIPGPYKRAIDAAQAAVAAAFREHGVPEGAVYMKKYDPDQPRDDDGKFGEGGGRSAGVQKPSGLKGRIGRIGAKAAGAIKRIAVGAKLQAQDTAHAVRTGIRALKGQSVSAEDKARAVTALKDAGKALVSAGIFAAPGGGLALAVIEKAANKLGGSIIPSRFHSTKAARPDKDWPSKLPSLAGVLDEDLAVMLADILAALSEPLDKHSEDPKMLTLDFPGILAEYEPVIAGATGTELVKRANKVGLPLADIDAAWDATAADKRLRVWAGAKSASDMEGIDWKKYGKALLYWASASPEGAGQFKLPVADVIDGEPRIVRKAVIAVKGVLAGARGGVDIPDADARAIQKITGDILDRFDEQMDKYGTSEGSSLGHANQGHAGEGGGGGGGKQAPDRFPSSSKQGASSDYSSAAEKADKVWKDAEKGSASSAGALGAAEASLKESLSTSLTTSGAKDRASKAIGLMSDVVKDREARVSRMESTRDRMVDLRMTAGLSGGEYDRDVEETRQGVIRAKEAIGKARESGSVKDAKAALKVIKESPSGNSGASLFKPYAQNGYSWAEGRAKDARVKKSALGKEHGDMEDETMTNAMTEMESCSDACESCVEACETCLKTQTKESCKACTEACHACAKACHECAEACDECDMPECSDCADACRACTEACNACAEACHEGPGNACKAACKACISACKKCMTACDACQTACEEEMGKADDGRTGDAILDADGVGTGEVHAESEDMGPELYEERDAINDAIRAKYGVGYYVCGVYPRSGYVLFRYCLPYVPGTPMEHGGKDKMFRAPYDEDADGQIVIGAAEEVERKVVFEPVVKSADGRLTYNGKRIEDGKFELLAPHGEEDILAGNLAKSDLFEEVEVVEGVGVRVRLAAEAMAKHGKADVLQVSGPFRIEDVQRTEYATEFLGTPDALAKGKERGIVYLKVYGPMEKDTQGEHANEEDIYDAAVAWMLRGAKINLMHKGKPTDDKVVFSDVTRVEGDLGLKKGTWFIAVKPTKENLARFKNGELTGASMEGSKLVVGSEEIAVA